MKLFVTGGHVTPALAVIDELKRLSPSTEILFLGRTIAMEGDKIPSLEYHMVTERGIRFLPITTGRLPRYLSPTILYSLMKFPIGIVQAFFYVLRHKPTAVLSFGGYVSVPVCFAAWLCQIPIYIHEQAMEPGLANRIIGKVAKKIFLSFGEQVSNFPTERTVVTGLPLRRSLFHPPKSPTFSYEKNLPILYITGGATGAKTLNELLFPIIGRLTKTFMVVHQTGIASYDKARQIRDSHYYIASSLGDSDVSWVYHHAALIVGRSGANTVGEIAALGKVSLFIPLPWAAGGEQEKNAQMPVARGSAEMLLQKNLKPDTILRKIDAMMKERKSYETKAQEFSKQVPKNAATVIAQELCRRDFGNTGNG